VTLRNFKFKIKFSMKSYIIKAFIKTLDYHSHIASLSLLSALVSVRYWFDMISRECIQRS